MKLNHKVVTHRYRVAVMFDCPILDTTKTSCGCEATGQKKYRVAVNWNPSHPHCYTRDLVMGYPDSSSRICPDSADSMRRVKCQYSVTSNETVVVRRHGTATMMNMGLCLWKPRWLIEAIRSTCLFWPNVTLEACQEKYSASADHLRANPVSTLALFPISISEQCSSVTSVDRSKQSSQSSKWTTAKQGLR